MEGIGNDGNDYFFNSNYFCLICCDEINPMSKELSKPPNVLDDIFFVLSNYLKWNQPGKEFEFAFELFPFCDKCIRTVEDIFELNQQVHEILRRIDQHCVNIFAKILESRNNSERFLKSMKWGSSRIIRHDERKKQQELKEFDARKVFSYRDVILSRFQASVTLKPLKNSQSPREEFFGRDKEESSGKDKLEGRREGDNEDYKSPNGDGVKKRILGRRPFSFLQIKPNLYIYANKYRARKKGDEFECLSCHKVLRNRKTAINHLRIHLHENKFRCGVCDQGFARRSNRDNHEKLHAVKKSYQCQRCKISYWEASKLRFHMVEEHGEKVPDSEVGSLSRDAPSKKSHRGEVELIDKFSAANKKDNRTGRLRNCEADCTLDSREDDDLKDNSGNAIEPEGEPKKMKMEAEADDYFSPLNLFSEELKFDPAFSGNSRALKAGKRVGNISAEIIEENAESNDEDYQPSHLPTSEWSEESDLDTSTNLQRATVSSSSRQIPRRESLRCQKKRNINPSRNVSTISDAVENPPELTADQETADGRDQDVDYHPSTSETSEESGDDTNEVLSGPDEDTEDETSTNRAVRTDLSNWVIGGRIREIDATHFIFDEKLPFERHGDGTFTCGNCGQNYKKIVNMRYHLLSNCRLQSGSRFKLEELSDKRFKYAGRIFQMLGEDKFKCSECEHVESTKAKAMGHIMNCHVCKSRLNIQHSELQSYVGVRKMFQIQELPDNKMRYRGFMIEKSENQFKCSTCLHIAETQADILRHIKKNHLPAAPPVQGKNSDDVTEIGKNKFQYKDSHQFEITETGLYKCLTCGADRPQKYIMLSHIFRCHIKKASTNKLVETSPNEFMYADKYQAIKTEEGKFKCVQCSTLYNQKRQLRNHFRKTHINRNKYKCDLCDKGFSLNSLLTEHKRRHANDKPVMCDLCGNTFVSSSRLRSHIKNVHTEKKNLCPLCGKVFALKSQLDLHLTVHTGIIKNPIVCEVCGKEMAKHKMAYHMTTHGPPQFKCSECNKTYQSEAGLKVHLANHGGKKPVQCKLCGKHFAFGGALRYHNWRFHSEHTAELDKKKRKIINKPGAGPLKCDECGRGFYEKRKLEGHKVRYHSELTAELDRQLKEKLCKSRK